MKDIICPKCGTPFHIDESTYSDIVSQVRSKEFNEEISRRLEEIKDQLKTKEETNLLQVEKEFENKLSKKEGEINDLKTEIIKLRGDISGFQAKKDSEISAIKEEKAKELFTALSEKEKKIAELKHELSENENRHKIALIEARNEGKEELQQKDRERLH